VSVQVVSKLRAFLAEQIAHKEGRQCMTIELIYAHGEDYRDEGVRSWTRDEYPEIFEDLSKIEQIVSAIIDVAKDHSDSIESASRRYVLRTIQYFGGRQLCSFKLAPRGSRRDGSASIHELRGAIAESVAHADSLIEMLDELGAYRAKERLGVKPQEPAVTDDLPPDGATGLYLDRPLDAEDLGWLKMAWNAYLPEANSPGRPTQLMLVFQAIRSDDRAMSEFLRVMNTVVLPLLRRLRLKEHPHLTKLGAAGE